MSMALQGVEAKYGVILKRLFTLISPIFWKNHDKPKFSWLALLLKQVFI